MSNLTRAIVVGPFGKRLGLPVCLALNRSPETLLLGTVSRTGAENPVARGGPDLAELRVFSSFRSLAEEVGIPAFTAERESIAVFYAVRREALLERVREAHRCGFRRHVIGTTGLLPEELQELKLFARDDVVVHASNFSVGANYWMEKCAETARRFPGAAVEILEMHHDQKVDSPSGTAKQGARAIAAARGQDFDKVVIYGRQGESKRRPEEICVHSIRGGSVTGFHRATFFLPHDEMSFEHNARSSQLFAEGALETILWSRSHAPRTGSVHGMCDVLNLPLLNELGVR